MKNFLVLSTVVFFSIGVASSAYSLEIDESNLVSAAGGGCEDCIIAVGIAIGIVVGTAVGGGYVGWRLYDKLKAKRNPEYESTIDEEINDLVELSHFDGRSHSVDIPTQPDGSIGQLDSSIEVDDDGYGFVISENILVQRFTGNVIGEAEKEIEVDIEFTEALDSVVIPISIYDASVGLAETVIPGHTGQFSTNINISLAINDKTYVLFDSSILYYADPESRIFNAEGNWADSDFTENSSTINEVDVINMSYNGGIITANIQGIQGGVKAGDIATIRYSSSSQASCPIPEPSTWILFCLGITGLLFCKKRKNASLS